MSTPTTVFELNDLHKRWAATLMEAESPDIGAAARLLKMRDFQPHVWEALAVRVVCAPDSHSFTPLEQAMLTSAAEGVLLTGVDQLCRSFFDMDVATRSQMHSRLTSKTRDFPVIQQMLEKLKPGLAVKPSNFKFDVPQERELATFALQVFPQWPMVAARMRREFAPTLSDQLRWAKVAVRLRRRAPAIASLIPEMLPVRRPLARKLRLPLSGRFPKKRAPNRHRGERLSEYKRGTMVLFFLCLGGFANVFLNRPSRDVPHIQPLPQVSHGPGKPLFTPEQLKMLNGVRSPFGEEKFQIGSPLAPDADSPPTDTGEPATFINADEVLRRPAEKGSSQKPTTAGSPEEKAATPQ